MKTPWFVLVLVSALGLLLGTAGCTSHAARAYGRPTVALAITVNGAPPTPQQFDAARRRMLPQIESYGWVLLDNPESAERIIRVDFVPDPLDPQNGGQVYVLGTYPNPLRRRSAIASTTYYSSPYEYRDYYFYPGVVGYWGYYGYHHHHDGHWGPPSGSSSGGASTSPNPPPNQTASTPPPPSSGRYSPPDDQPVRRGKYMHNEPVRRIAPPSSGSGYSSYSGSSSSSYSGGSSSNYSGGSSSSYSGGSSGGSSGSSWTPSAPASSDSSSSSSARNGGERVEKER